MLALSEPYAMPAPPPASWLVPAITIEPAGLDRRVAWGNLTPRPSQNRT